MRKLLAMLLAFWMLFSMTACNLSDFEFPDISIGDLFDKPEEHTHSYDENGQCTGCDRKVSVGLSYSYPDLQYKGYYVSGIGSCTDTEIVIPETYKGSPVVGVEKRAFEGCANIISIEFPDTIRDFGEATLTGCSSLQKITVPAILNVYEQQLGYLFGTEEYPGSVAIVQKETYYLPEGLAEVSVTGTKLPSYFFSNCKQIKKIEILEGINYIESFCFKGCTGLTTIAIPDSVTKIGNNAFSDCRSLETVCIRDLAAWCQIKFYEGASNPLSRGGELYINGTLATEITIPDSVTRIGNYAFYNCSSLTSINIPDSVTSIGEEAFRGCESLTSISIPDGVTRIGNDAFRYCRSLTSISIPDSVTSIGYRAFSDCSSLASINIPDSVTSIGEEAFDGCSSLTSINIPDGVTSIGDYAFSDCSSLTSINIPDGVTSIGDYSFSDCSSLTSINIPDGVTSIGNYAFSDCSSLASINIPDSVTSIGSDAFSYCSSLTSITFAGTMEQWNAIEKGYRWNQSTGDYTVYCTDGEVKKGE